MPLPRYAVFGNPIAHSRSPWIHKKFAEQTGQTLTYEAIKAPLDGFVETVENFQRLGGLGINVTVPFKLDAFALAKIHSTRAERAGAVNTLIWQADHWLGDNTDGVGLMQDLLRHGVPLKDRTVLVLGAGGAARGILGPLLAMQPATLAIYNRNPERAVLLAELFASDARRPIATPTLIELAQQTFDVVINATAAGLQSDAAIAYPSSLFTANTTAVDLMYGNAPTAFLRWCTHHGAARCIDGLGMLVEQAAESFFLWRGVRPDTAPVLAELRAKLLAETQS